MIEQSPTDTAEDRTEEMLSTPPKKNENV